MAKSKQLSTPISTGGAGAFFEAQVQSMFVTLMLSGGYAPCLPCWPIIEIKLQGKVDGFDTDDLIVYVKNANTGERRKLLAQIKLTITITNEDRRFDEVIQAAWNDYNNSKNFKKGKDAIALITGPLSATDTHNVQWILEQARHTKNTDEFFTHVHQAKFSPSKSTEKLEVIEKHLKAANGGNEVERDKLYSFLRHFHLLVVDLDKESGVVLSLLHSHISLFKPLNVEWVWPRIVAFVQEWNRNAGTIAPDKLPEDLQNAFNQKFLVAIPDELRVAQENSEIDWAQQPDATFIALLVLIGTWNEKNQSDIDVISQMLGINYDEWLKKAQELLHYHNTPLSVKNGVWKINNRTELWNLLGSRVLDKNLDTFISLAVTILKERDPAFELPVEERFAASIHNKVFLYSHEMRKGISEGLAVLGSSSNACIHCSVGKAKENCKLALIQLFSGADWILWGSLNDLLPALAEADPGEFLNAVEKALRQIPCPFYRLFSEESSGVFGRNYLTGLLWALEALAWEEQYLVRICVILGELASHDPGGQWSNRPSNSLVTILLPWFPQTLASVDKRKVAVQILLKEWPDIGWNLIIQLLPNQHTISSGSYKPVWRKTIKDQGSKEVTKEEYLKQISIYAELAVHAAECDANRLSDLIQHLDSLPPSVFNQIINRLDSPPILQLAEDQRFLIWDSIRKFTVKHRRFSDAQWALPGELIIRLEKVSEHLIPKCPSIRYKFLFTTRDLDLFEKNSDWKEQQKQLDVKREAAIKEIFDQNGVEGIIRFAESVDSPRKVGVACAAIDDFKIDAAFLPHFLDPDDAKRNDLVKGFILQRQYLYGLDWCDNLDKSNWTPAQIGKFLACLPFIKTIWDRASEWLKEQEQEYWTRVEAIPYQCDGDLNIAIEKLIKYNRPYAAINCLSRMLYENQLLNTDQCVRALLAISSSDHPETSMDIHNIVEIIKHLQTENSAKEEDLIKVEWAFLPLLESYSEETAPKFLESRMANVPEFFCEIIRLIYRPKNEAQPPKELTEKEKSVALNAWRLLQGWKILPGTQKDGTFDPENFKQWLQRVKELTEASGHLEVAMNHIGEVLINSPADPNGLWIHQVVAQALNDRNFNHLRRGFMLGFINSRGAHSIVPTGEEERNLANQCRYKADAAENMGFHRLAATMRELAEHYDHEAERIIDEFNNDDE